MEYKAEESGCEIVAADRFYPSSKTCSTCKAKAKQMPLSKREWNCPECGTHHHRDANAAINLMNYAIKNAVSSTVSACGEFSANDATPSRGSVKRPL